MKVWICQWPRGHDRPAIPRRGASIGFEQSPINKTYKIQDVTYEGLTAVDPDIARQRDIRPLLLDGARAFLCVSGRGRAGAAKRRRGGP